MSTDDATLRWLEQSRTAWDERADMFDELSSRNAKTEDRTSELDFVFAELGIGPGSHVLDAGCGTGHFAIAFAERGCVVDGIDVSPEMIDRAGKHAAEAGVDLQLSVGDLLPLKASDRAYDAIVSRMALQFSPHLSAVLNEFQRTIAMGGKLWLAVPGSLSPVYRHSWKRFLLDTPEPMNYVTPWELIRLLEDQGWTIRAQWGSFDSIGSDTGNAAEHLEPGSLPLPLQQAAATVWNMIAGR